MKAFISKRASRAAERIDARWRERADDAALFAAEFLEGVDRLETTRGVGQPLEEHQGQAVTQRRHAMATWVGKKAPTNADLDARKVSEPGRRGQSARPQDERGAAAIMEAPRYDRRSRYQLTIEREKRFELSTSTLARLHSTTELLPQWQGAFLAAPSRTVKARP